MYLNCIIEKLQVVARQLPMAILIQLSDWVYRLKHSKITQKKIKQFYCDETCLIFFTKMNHGYFFVEEIKEAFLLQKGVQKMSK